MVNVAAPSLGSSAMTTVKLERVENTVLREIKRTVRPCFLPSGDYVLAGNMGAVSAERLADEYRPSPSAASHCLSSARPLICSDRSARKIPQFVWVTRVNSAMRFSCGRLGLGSMEARRVVHFRSSEGATTAPLRG